MRNVVCAVSHKAVCQAMCGTHISSVCMELFRTQPGCRRLKFDVHCLVFFLLNKNNRVNLQRDEVIR